MSKFDVHTIESAPAGSEPVLRGMEKKMGFVPNLLRVMAESPSALSGYTKLSGIFHGSSLAPVEQHVVLLTSSRRNGCAYCMAAHSTMAGMSDVPPSVIDAIRGDTPIENERLEALRSFTAKVVDERGLLPAEDVDAFLATGFTKAQVLEVITGIAAKTISTYTDHLTHPPIDEAFAERAWSAPAAG